MKRVKLFLMLMLLTVMSVESWGVDLYVYAYEGEGHGSLSPSGYSNKTAGTPVTITATPDAGYTSEFYMGWYGNSMTDVDVTKVGNTYTFTMPSDYTYIYINFVALPSRTVKFMVPTPCVTSPTNNTTTSASVFPYPSPRTVDGYKFEGWVSSSVSPTTTRPATVYAAGAAIPSNGTYYALYSTVNAEFDKITGTTMPVDGGNYMLCSAYAADARVINNDINDTKHRLQTTAWDMSGSTANCKDWSCIWTFVQGTGTYSGYWFVYNQEKNKYLGVTGIGAEDSNDRKMQLRDDQDDYTAWSCSVLSGKITLTSKKRSSDTNKILKCYSSDAGIYSGGSAPYFFKQGTLTATYTTSPSCAAETYSVTYAGGS